MPLHETQGVVGDTVTYVTTQLLRDLAAMPAEAIDSAPQLKRRLLDMLGDRRLGKLRLFDRDGRIGFSLVPYD